MTARFIRRGVSKFYFCPTVTGSRPTRAQITSGTDLTPFIADVAGWMLENNTVATPDMGSSFDSNIPGTDQVSDSSFTFYEDLVLNTIETLLPKGTPGFVVIMRKGDVSASLSMDTFPVRVRSKGSEFSAGNDPARFMVQFAITSTPDLDGAVPA